MDNLETPVVENPTTQDVITSTDAGSVAQAFSWKGSVGTDLRNSPLLQKFEDTPDGLNKALESHANLEKLLGHEKVPIPKGVDDVDGWNRFSKALGIPDKAEGYGLPDAAIPEEMKGLSLDKNKFAEIVHAHKLTPAQAKGLWEAYSKETVDSYSKVMEEQQKSLVNTVNQLKSEWGDAYETNVELSQMVINKFADNQEANDYITSMLVQDPRGIKFLAKIGSQFAENKIGNFQVPKFSTAPEQAQAEIAKILRDPSHPYLNDKATNSEREAAIDYVNSLYAAINRGKG